MWYNFCKKENTLFFVLFLTICSNDKQYNFPKLSISSYFYLVWEKMCPWQFDWKLLNIILHHDIRNEDELHVTCTSFSLYIRIYTTCAVVASNKSIKRRMKLEDGVPNTFWPPFDLLRHCTCEIVTIAESSLVVWTLKWNTYWYFNK